MASATQTNPQTEPAPARRRVSSPLLFFGVTAAPLAWIVQNVVNATLAGTRCGDGLEHGGRVALLIVDGVAALIAVAAIAVSVQAWRSVRGEHAGRGDLLEVAEGRTRFVAMCGILTGVGFLVGIIFASLVAGGVTQCAG